MAIKVNCVRCALGIFCVPSKLHLTDVAGASAGAGAGAGAETGVG